MVTGRFGRLLAAMAFMLLPASSPRSEPQHQFVGSATCAECHDAETKAWSESDHAWALKEPNARSMLGDFNDASLTHKGVTSRFFMKDGKYFVETDGASGKPETFAVRYAVGHRPLQQYLVETTSGRLQVLDIAWDVQAKRWFHLYPDQDLPAGDGMHWTGTYKNWQARCATCHQTGFDKGYDFPTRTYKSHWSELTVGCETCHGPGKDHVETARQGNPRQSLMPKLGAGQQENEINVCGPCHARRDAFSQVQPPAGSPFHDHYALSLLTPDLYFGDGQQNAEVFILGSFLQSKMKAKGVTCSNCHEPHSNNLVAEGNAVCTQCHNEAGRSEFPTIKKADYDTPAHHHHPAGSEAALCVTCHMPERSYMVIDPRRDHFFRMPDPLQSKAAGAPDVCTTCHKDQTPEWAAGKIATWFPDSNRSWQDRGALIAFNAGGRQEGTLAELAAFIRNRETPGIARATALRAVAAEGMISEADAGLLLKDDDALVRAATAGALRHIPAAERIGLLTPLLSDPVRSVRQTAAIEIAGAGVAALPPDADAKFRAGLQEYLDSRLANADTPEGHMAIGGMALSRRKWEDAEAAFRTAAEMDPQLTQAWLVLSQIREARGDAPGTEAALTSAIAASPRNIELLLARAGFEARRQRTDDALGWYRRALALDENRADAWLGMGIAALYGQKPELALDYAVRAEALDPRNPEAAVVQAMAHAMRGEREEAKKAAERARTIAPGIRMPEELERLLAPQ
jgi:predicted CXXCH cytochrome family protein